MFENVFKFLELQKSEMMRLDEAEGYTKLQRRRGDFTAVDQKSGRKLGLREILYDQTIGWIRSQSGRSLQLEMMKLTQPGVLNEDTLSTAIADLTTALLPAVRRIYSNLIAMDLVSVQPLNNPSGYIYWLDHVYAETTDEVTAGDRLDAKRPKEYALSSEQATIKEINYKLTKKLIETVNYKLKADWTIEAEQDLRSQWKLDLESEIISSVT